MENLGAVLESAGSSLSNVIKVNIYLTDLNDFATMNEIYETFFETPKPVICWHLRHNNDVASSS